jgi:hypothetical protein
LTQTLIVSTPQSDEARVQPPADVNGGGSGGPCLVTRKRVGKLLGQDQVTHHSDLAEYSSSFLRSTSSYARR